MGTSRSALRFSLLFTFILTSVAASRGDRFLFRVADQVVGGDDIRQGHEDLAALICHFPDSLLLEYMGEGFVTKMGEQAKAIKNLEGPLGKQTSLTIFLSSVRQSWKLLVYVDSQEVEVNAALQKGLLEAKDCPSVAGDNGLRTSFRKWLRVEIYLRSRYNQGKSNPDVSRKDKRFQSINLFVDSLDKQITHEDFW